MAVSATPFQPTTDRFGELTLHANDLRRRVTGIRFQPSARTRNGAIVAGFLAVFALALGGLFAADRAVYAGHDAPVFYSAPVDYD